MNMGGDPSPLHSKRRENMKTESILLPTQKKFYYAPQKYLAYIGGFGSGKSLITCLMALRLAQLNQGTPGMIVSPSYKMLYDPILATMGELLEEREIPYRHQKTLNTLILPFGEIYLRSGDDPNSLRGPNLAWFAIDEACMVDHKVWKICISRIRHKKAKQLKGVVSSTPEGLDWLYQEFVEKAEGGKRPRYKTFQAGSTENIFLPEDFVEDLKEDYDENLAQAYVYGEFVDIGRNRAYHAFGEHNLKPLEYNRYAPICLTCDFNVAPMVWEIFQHYGNRLHFLDEISIPDNASTEGAIEKFVETYRAMIKGGGESEVHIYGDASGQHRRTTGDSDYIVISEFLKSKNIPFIGKVPPGNPPVKDRLNSVNAVLKDRGDETRMFIDPRCEHLIKDLRMVVLTKHNDIDKRRQSLTHASDAMGYGVMQTMPIRQRSTPKQIVTMNRF